MACDLAILRFFYGQLAAKVEGLPLATGYLAVGSCFIVPIVYACYCMGHASLECSGCHHKFSVSLSTIGLFEGYSVRQFPFFDNIFSSLSPPQP